VLKAQVTNTLQQDIRQVEVVSSVADHHGRPLIRNAAQADFAAGEQKFFNFEFRTQDFPPAPYSWTLEIRRNGGALMRETKPLVRMETWRFRKELVVAPFGFGPLQSETEIEALGSLGLTTYGLPPSFGMWTYLIHSPTFVPRHGWPAQILEGPEGDEWRELAAETRQNPLFTFADTVEEADLQIGSNLLAIGDVEEAGHEQYRIYLKRKYGTLSALNEAWKSDVGHWDEIDLLGGVVGKDGEVIYTGSIGMTTGDLVAAPKELDPAKSIASLQPFHDQNAWRWYYLWHLLEIRHAAFHQVDPFHALTPGGAMGLHAPFDYPHFRTYAWEPLSHFGRRATFGRPAYGTKPHTLLFGVPGDPPALSKLCWQGIAGGARFLMPYAPGDYLGVPILRKDYTPLPIGIAFRDILRRIKSKQEVLLATHNAVERRALFLSEGDSGYGSSLSLELYEALLGSGILVDYGSDLDGRALVITGSPSLSAKSIEALRAFVERGGVLLALANASCELLAKFGLTREDEKLPKDFQSRIVFAEKGPLPGLAGASLPSSSRATLKAVEGNWETLAAYPDDNRPAVLAAPVGKGAVFAFNFVKPEPDLEAKYKPGEARTEAERFRRLIAAVAERAGVQGVFQTVDTDGSAIPYVEVQPLETEDRSQTYLVAYSDNRLPAGVNSADGRLRVKLPGVKRVYDVYAERDLPLTDGTFAFHLEPGEGTVFSLLTEELTQVLVAPELKEFGPGAPLRLRIEVRRADGKPSACEHAFNLSVIDPAGAELAALQQRVSLKGQGIVSLFPSWSDPDGEWKIAVHDLTAGLKAETSVTKRNDLPAPPVAPTDAFRPAKPDIRLTVQELPELNAFAHFVIIAVTLQNESPKPVKVKVGLRVPAECLLSGEPEQVIELVPGSPAKALEWETFITHENAVSFHYSDKTSGFLTDSFRPEVYRYANQSLPSIDVATVGGEKIRLQQAGNAVSEPVERLSYRIPVRMNPFQRAPARIGNFQSEPVEISVLNATRTELTGALRVKPLESWGKIPAEIRFKAEPSAVFKGSFTTQLLNVALADPGVRQTPASVQIAGKTLPAGQLRVEHVRQRQWLVRPGDEAAAIQGRLPFNPGADFQGKEWRSLVSESRIPLRELLPKVGSTAYAACYVVSPDEREVQVRLWPTGANVRVWLNGALAYTSDSASGAKKESASPVADGEEEEDTEFLKQVAPGLRKGRDHLVVEVSRSAKRYRDAVLVLFDKNGKAMRDLVFVTAVDKAE
jgi:hypothetical protein